MNKYSFLCKSRIVCNHGTIEAIKTRKEDVYDSEQRTLPAPALHQIDNLAKPPEVLGFWKSRPTRFYWHGTFHRELRPKHIIFAADNGVVRAGCRRSCRISRICRAAIWYRDVGRDLFSARSQISLMKSSMSVSTVMMLSDWTARSPGDKELCRRTGYEPESWRKPWRRGRERCGSSQRWHQSPCHSAIGIGNDDVCRSPLQHCRRKRCLQLTGFSSAPGQL